MLKATDIMTDGVIKVKKTDSVSAVIGALKEAKTEIAAVFDGKKFIGITSQTKLLKSSLQATKISLSKLTAVPPHVTAGESITTIAELMCHNYPCIIPVKKGSAILGFVRDTDLLGVLKGQPELMSLPASQVMTPNPVTLKYTDRLGTALNLMREKHLSRIPVLDKYNRVVSVISFKNILLNVLPVEKTAQKGTLLHGKGHTPERTNLLDTNIGDIASLVITTVSPQDSVASVIAQMEKLAISEIIVAVDNKPAGLITSQDLIELFLRLKEREQSPIHIIKSENLKPMQLAWIKSQMEDELAAYRKQFDNILYFNVHIKVYEEGERSRTKWSVHMRLATPLRLFVASESNYDLNTAISWALRTLRFEVRRSTEKFRSQHKSKGLGRRKSYERYQLARDRRDKWQRNQREQVSG